MFLQTSIIQSTKQTKRSCLALLVKVCQIFHGYSPHPELCCSSHKCMFLTNVASLKRKISRLSNNLRLIATKHCYNKDMIYQTQMSLLDCLVYICIYVYNKKINKNKTSKQPMLYLLDQHFFNLGVSHFKPKVSVAHYFDHSVALKESPEKRVNNCPAHIILPK